MSKEALLPAQADYIPNNTFEGMLNIFSTHPAVWWIMGRGMAVYNVLQNKKTLTNHTKRKNFANIEVFPATFSTILKASLTQHMNVSSTTVYAALLGGEGDLHQSLLPVFRN